MTPCTISTTEIIIIGVVSLQIFGGKNSELMKGLGQGIRQFKDGLNDNQTLHPYQEDKYRLREEANAKIIREKKQEELNRESCI